MVSSGKRIPITDLRRGMFVADVFNDQDVLLYSASTLITSDHQVESLISQGVTSVYILSDEPTKFQDDADTGPAAGEGSDDVELSSGESVVAYANFQNQVRSANAVVGSAVQTMRETMHAARMGKMFQARGVEAATEKLVEKVLRDPDVYFWLMQIKSADDYLFKHSVNVAMMTAAFAEELQYPPYQVLEIALGGMVHDIGKIKLPELLWLKNGNCTRSEFDLFKTHPQLGLEITGAGSQRLSESVRTIISRHHERWNGSGYPARLKEEHIGEIALICGLADVFDQLTTTTPYRAAALPQEAMAMLFQGADTEYPRTLVERFTRLLGIYPVGSCVKLKSNESGMVIRTNRSNLLLPAVLILIDKKGKLLEKPFVRDLSAGSLHPADHVHFKIDHSLDPFRHGIDPARFFGAVAS